MVYAAMYGHHEDSGVSHGRAATADRFAHEGNGVVAGTGGPACARRVLGEPERRCRGGACRDLRSRSGCADTKSGRVAAWLRSSRRFDRRHGHRTLSRTGDPQSEGRRASAWHSPPRAGMKPVPMVEVRFRDAFSHPERNEARCSPGAHHRLLPEARHRPDSGRRVPAGLRAGHRGYLGVRRGALWPSARKVVWVGTPLWRTILMPRLATYQSAVAAGSGTFSAMCSIFIGSAFLSDLFYYDE